MLDTSTPDSPVDPAAPPSHWSRPDRVQLAARLLLVLLFLGVAAFYLFATDDRYTGIVWATTGVIHTGLLVLFLRTRNAPTVS